MAEQKIRLKATFKVEENGRPVEYAVRRPNPKEMAEGQKVYNKAFREAIEADAIIRPKLELLMRQQKLWDDEKTAQQERLNTDIMEKEKLLGRGYRLETSGDGKTNHKIPLKISEARQVAIDLRNLRMELSELLSVRSQLDNMTAEAQADNARFNYYVAKGLVYNEGTHAGEQVYKSVEDYLEHGSEERAYVGAGQLMNLFIGGSDPDWQKKLPENRFLTKYGFVDEKLRLVNKDGHLIDAEGRLINDKGRYVNPNGELVNRDGEKVNEEGERVYEDRVEFEDDMGLTTPKTEEEKAPVEDSKNDVEAPQEVETPAE